MTLGPSPHQSLYYTLNPLKRAQKDSRATRRILYEEVFRDDAANWHVPWRVKSSRPFYSVGGVYEAFSSRFHFD
jgi:hypothetical protein